MTAGEALTPEQARAVELLAAGVRIGTAAEELGIHRATLWEWTRQPAFRAALDGLRREAWRATEDRMRLNTCRAAEVLGDILNDSQASARDKVTAARVILAASAPIFSRGVPAETRGLEKDADPVRTWEQVIGSTIKKVMAWDDPMASLTLETRDGTLGERWARAGLPREAWLALWEARGNPTEVQRLCDEPVARLETQRTIDAFARRDPVLCDLTERYDARVDELDPEGEEDEEKLASSDRELGELSAQMDARLAELGLPAPQKG